MKNLLLLFCLLFAAGSADAQCVSSFSATQTPSGNNLLNVVFTNSSSYGLPFTGQKKSMDIYYGDAGGAGNLFSYPGTSIPNHVYSAPGTYTASLKIRSYDSASNTTICTDSAAITVTVAYPACGATITVTGTGATKTFTANNPAATSGITYSWNYGDGNTGTGSPINHTYAASGTYTVTLVASTGSCTYTNSTTVVVYIAPPPLNCASLKASFTASVSGNVGSFTNTSNIASGAYQTIGSWDYGDGTTGSGYTTPAHSYSTPGVYTVKLVMQWKDSLNTTSCRDSATRTITVSTVPSPANIISGNVIYDTSFGREYFKVYLIKLDTSTMILSAVDSLITGNTAAPYYAFGSKPAGLYRVKAAVHNGTSFGTGFIPTYHDSSLYWNLATVITHTGGSTLNKRIYVRRGVVSAGPGFIGGNVSMGANKGASGGVPNLMIYLRDANMRVIQTAITDGSGNYSFPNIPYGPYSIWPEQINYTTLPVTPIVLNATYPSRTDIHFNMDDSKRSIAPRNELSVGSQSLSSDFITIAPVPANDVVTITWNGMNDATAQFTITNITGKIVARTAVLQGHAGSTQVNLNGLAHGVYFVHGSGTLAAKVTRLVIQ